MADTKLDLLEKCNQAKIPVVTHVTTKCSKCKKADCIRAALAPK
jgi:hypothetical protein